MRLWELTIPGLRASEWQMPLSQSYRRYLWPRDRTIRVLAALFLAALLLWIGFAILIAPALIESAYRGESLAALNAVIEGRGKFPVEHYLEAWRTVAAQLTFSGVAYGLLGVFIAALASRPAFFRRYVGEATPATLGVIRLITCAALLVTTSWEDLASVALLPAEMRRQAGAMRLVAAIPGFDEFLANAGALAAWQRSTELLLFLGAIGCLTRVVIPLAAIAHFVVLGILIDYSFFWHQNLIPLYLLAVLSFTPCGDGFSVDRVWKLAHGRPVPEGPAAVYGWSRYICWLVIVLPYVQAGLSKLRVAGLSWSSAANMRGMLYGDNLSPREYDWNLSRHLVSLPDSVFTLLGVTTIVLEICFVLVLFSRRARQILPPLMLMVHVGIFLLQRILFFDLILLQLVFVDFGAVRQATGRALAAGHGSIERFLDRFRVRSRGMTPIPAERSRPAASAGLRYVLMASALVVMSVICWVHRVEFYPLTAWHLYAMLDTSGTVSYRKVLARHESGATSPVRLEEAIGAMALDGRYTPMLDKCFGEADDIAMCRKFLTASGAAYNARRPSGSRLTHFEIQTWKWDYASSPTHPEQGQLVERIIVEIPTSGGVPPSKGSVHPSGQPR